LRRLPTASAVGYDISSLRDFPEFGAFAFCDSLFVYHRAEAGAKTRTLHKRREGCGTRLCHV